LASYPTKEFFNRKKKAFNKTCLPDSEASSFLKVGIASLNIILVVRDKCVITSCRNDAQEIHYIKKLARRLRTVFFSLSSSYLLQG
jgi:hypothetical protein